MPVLNQTQRLWALCGLIALMFATRFHHFGSVRFLPDASLSIFFLGGFYLFNKQPEPQSSFSYYLSKPVIAFSLLTICAGLIDYMAINQGGVSDWCMSPAYLFLIPTYAVMYFAGRWSQRYKQMQLQGSLKTALTAILAVALAFIISNGSFYLFSGRYAEMDSVLYAQSTAPYFIPYAGYALLYIGLIFSVQIAWVKSSQDNTLEQV